MNRFRCMAKFWIFSSFLVCYIVVVALHLRYRGCALRSCVLMWILCWFVCFDIDFY